MTAREGSASRRVWKRVVVRAVVQACQDVRMVGRAETKGEGEGEARQRAGGAGERS